MSEEKEMSAMRCANRMRAYITTDLPPPVLEAVLRGFGQCLAVRV